MPDVKIGVHQEAVNTSTGVQTFTNANLDGKTPKAALAFMTNATVADTVTANSHLSLGATDGTNEWVLSRVSIDDLPSSSAPVRSVSSIDETLLSINSTGIAVQGKAEFSAFSADSTELNLTESMPSAFLVSMVQFAGDDVKAEVGTINFPTTMGGTETVILSDSLLLADIILVVYDPTANASLFQHSYTSIGCAVRTDGLPDNFCISHNQLQGFTPTNLAAAVRDDRCATAVDSVTQLKSLECTDISTGQFTVTTRDSTNSTPRQAKFLALSFGGAQVKAGTIETPTDDTVDWDVTGVGFQPQFVFSAFSGIALSSGYNTVSTAEVAGPLSLWAFDGSNEAGVAISSRDAATTTETLSITREGLQSRIIVGFESDLVKLNSPTMNSDGWSVSAADIDTANATARQGIYFAVENAGATIAPITGSTSIAFSSAATAAAINQIAASASVNFPAIASLTSFGGPYTTTYNLLTGIRNAILGGTDALTTAIGNRVTVSFLPQDTTLPAIVYTMQTVSRLPDMTDLIADSRVTFGFDVYGRTHLEAAQISDALDQTIRGISSLETINVQEIERLSIVDLSESQGDVMVWRITSDYAMYFQDT